MNKLVFSIFIVLLLFWGCKNKPLKSEQFQSILAAAYLKHPDAVGIMVHIEAPDQAIAWSSAVGFSDWEKTIPIEADQPALIASITKNYVAVSILRLVEQNKIQLYQSLDQLLSKKTSALMRQYGFDLQAIKMVHLLSHKSGIPGHVGTSVFQEKMKNDPLYRWTRDEQIELAISQGVKEPPGTRFHYTDTNYLLLTEIIEQITDLPFYDAIRELIGYQRFGLNHTWFYTLEDIPFNTKSLVHQYVPENDEDSYKIDNSVDLYGGGGIASTTEDLAKYAYHVFQGDVFDNKETLKLMFTDVKAAEGDSIEDYIGDIPCEYFLGIQESGFDGLNSYWHAGYWGTIFRYFPDLNTAIVLYVLNEDEFEKIELDLMRQFTALLQQPKK